MLGIPLIEIPLGLLYSNAFEWTVHRYLLHGLGKNKKTFFSFHWHDHHRNSRRDAMRDEDYFKPLFRWSPAGKEALSLFLAALLHAPLLLIAPVFTFTIWYGALNYYFRHKKAHRDPVWAREHLPWHVDHHMGPNQDKNWCVTRPWFDILMGTREKYVGTALEQRTLERQYAREQKREANANAGASASWQSKPAQ